MTTRAGPGLGTALVTYLTTLAAVIALVVLEVRSVRTTLLFDVSLLVFGIGLTIAFWPTLGRGLGRPRPIPGRLWLVTLGALLTLFLVVQLLAVLAPDLFRNLMSPYRNEELGLTFAVLQMGPLTAAAEELLFRGVILSGLSATFPERTAIIVSALMFATLHLSPLNFVHTSLMGVVYALLTVRTGSLWPSIGLHAAWNIAFLLIDL